MLKVKHFNFFLFFFVYFVIFYKYFMIFMFIYTFNMTVFKLFLSILVLQEKLFDVNCNLKLFIGIYASFI